MSSPAPASSRPNWRISSRELLLIFLFWTSLATISTVNRLLDPRAFGLREVTSGPIVITYLESWIWAALTPAIFWLSSQEMKAMPQPVLVAFRSVGSVRVTKSRAPALNHPGAVEKSESALLETLAAHQRESASPVLSPHSRPFIAHSLNSASNSATMRSGLPNEASTSIASPTLKSHPPWSAPPVPSVVPLSANTITLTGPPVIPKIALFFCTTPSAAASRSLAFCSPGAPREGST